MIQTVLLAALQKHSWFIFQDESPPVVVLSAQLRSAKRGGFAELLEREIKTARADLSSNEYASNHYPLSEVDLDRLLAIKRKGLIGAYLAPEVRPLKSYSWDKRILIRDLDKGMARPEARLKKVNLYLTTELPVYSADGAACILDVTFPWWGSDTLIESDSFLLLRQNGHWMIAYMDSGHPL